MTYGIIIIGGGPAGLSAGMYSARMNMKTLVLALMPGGLLMNIHDIENWPGEKMISGMDLANKLMEHATVSGSEIKFEEAISVTKSKDEAGKDIFKVKTSGTEYDAYSVMFATGGKHRLLDVPGEKEFSGKGVSYCALCDANFFIDKTVVVVGGGDAAAKDAILLAERCKKVYLLVRSILRAEPANITIMEQNPKIEIMYKEEVAEIFGDKKASEGGKVNKIKLKSGKELQTDGVFVAIGQDPLNMLAKDLGVELNSRGEIIVDKKCQTNVPGIFAAGDCTDIDVKQAILGSAQAVMASYSAFKYVRNLLSGK